MLAKHSWLLLAAALAMAACGNADVTALELPEGFSLRVVTIEVKNARQMALDDDGTLFVGTRRQGSVYAIANALTDANPQVIELATGLTMPTGVAVKDGQLYVGATNRILRFDAGNLVANAPFEVVTEDLPDKRMHGWKYLKFGPDGALYVPVGAPCNICLSEDPRFASILRMNAETGETTIFAQGIRNSVGFAWHPTTQHLWFTDNGRDLMGDDVPSEEVNVATRPGQHFGYPFIHAGDVPDPEYGKGVDAATYQPPTVKIQAHSAALGATFYTGSQFPPEYQGALFIAEHGSWNRSVKVGYRISVVTMDRDAPHYQPFIRGWLEGQRNWGRPNDVLVAPDGSLLISDDQAGAIYQVTYQAPR
ncbi:MAG: PQQ-dependent sugar dehydrogenase [Gammaproteobacteria bacterium]|nr:PQQ-dependent sugar dehydrogenase [Gammaproteobacteria bacterium]